MASESEQLTISRRSHDRQALAYLLSTLALFVAIYALVAVLGVRYADVKQGWVGGLSLAVLSGAADSNLLILSREAGEGYANLFASAQAVMSIIILPATVGYIALGLRALKFRRLATPMAVLTLFIGLGLLQWSCLSGDFFGAADGDYSGRLRPMFGWFALPAAAWGASFTLGSGMAAIWKRWMSTQQPPHSGNAASD